MEEMDRKGKCPQLTTLMKESLANFKEVMIL